MSKRARMISSGEEIIKDFENCDKKDCEECAAYRNRYCMILALYQEKIIERVTDKIKAEIFKIKEG